MLLIILLLFYDSFRLTLSAWCLLNGQTYLNNFEPNFKLWWCRARDLFGSQIPVTTRGFELPISSIQSSYQTFFIVLPVTTGGFELRISRIWSSYLNRGLGNYFACKRFTVQTLLWPLEIVIRINLEQFETWL